MIQIIIATGITLLLLEALSGFTKKDVKDLNDDDLILDYARFFKANDETLAKMLITRTINRLIKNSKSFKIGKSGNPKGRKVQYTKFNKMYIIVESKEEHFIEKLERIYNEKYISSKKNTNCKIGSAGKMTGKTGKYYLYFVSKE